MIDFDRKAYAYWAMRARLVNTGYMSVALYSGPVTTLDDILTGSINDLTATGEETRILKEHLRANLEDLGHTLLHVARYTHDSNLIQLDDVNFAATYKFSRSNLTPTFIAAGTATHALLIFHADNYVQNGNAYYFFWGTVGAIGSGADIEISDTGIVADSNVFHNDFKVQIT